MGSKGVVHALKVQFSSTLSLLMLEPYERVTIYVFLGVILLMLLYTSVIYLPSHVRHLAHLFGVL